MIFYDQLVIFERLIGDSFYVNKNWPFQQGLVGVSLYKGLWRILDPILVTLQPQNPIE
jgi:hypothetical protein